MLVNPSGLTFCKLLLLLEDTTYKFHFGIQIRITKINFFFDDILYNLNVTIKGAMDKYNIYLFIFYSIEDFK